MERLTDPPRKRHLSNGKTDGSRKRHPLDGINCRQFNNDVCYWYSISVLLVFQQMSWAITFIITEPAIDNNNYVNQDPGILNGINNPADNLVPIEENNSEESTMKLMNLN
ncbi:hypothetical protein RclHR1_24060004 [Rhizophagus clarus]|uniref:Uncharacterized protein n=1 Tax=Rhizophagus clarus TaxID=94130 RepID=A0A2Z6QYQ9_9GLOM|nr:hypothetical protein RclHR1_24060004 [Rhizophagus clarus]